MLRPAVLIVLLLAAGIHGCTTNPITGKKQPSLMSEEREIATGREFDPKIRKQYGVYDDPELQAYVTRVGKKLAAQSHRTDLVYRFTVLDSPEVNAFALPGGYIYITRGLMAYLNSEAELAAVLGHEIGHVTAKHAMRQYTTATAASIGYTIGALFIPELANQNAANLFNVLGSALISGYGREHELEADRLGAEYLARGGYDPQAILAVLGVFKNQEEFEKERAKIEGREARVYHGVFASHPSADQRLQEVVAESKQSTAATPRVGRDEFLAQVDGVLFGDSVRQGIRYNQKFFHSKLGFALEFPPGWRIENRPKQIEATSRDSNAVMVLTVEDLNRRISPREFMLKRLRLKKLKQEGTLTGTDLEGYTAITRVHGLFGLRHTRVTVVYFNDKAYIFHATGKTDSAFQAADELFLQTARSLHALTGDEHKLAQGLRITIIDTNHNDSFAELAVGSPIPNYPARMLRLINDKYPQGRPGVGKLKVIR
ncbi:MAG: M48 family metalloprotease [Gammaproteobacteria bacterium]|nr:M48 family metalloprotease [Gammaproteobacteria bacterium]